jgi:hypothetical protein
MIEMMNEWPKVNLHTKVFHSKSFECKVYVGGGLAWSPKMGLSTKTTEIKVQFKTNIVDKLTQRMYKL